MKQNRHSMMAKGIMVLLALLVLVFIFTYAWFIDANAPVSANGLRLSTRSGADFEVAIGFTSPDTGGSYLVSNFSQPGTAANIDFEKIYVPQNLGTFGGENIVNPTYSSDASRKFNLLAHFKPVDLTGNGVSLYRPEMKDKNRSINFDATRVHDDIVENKQYITFDLYFRSTTPNMDISLGSASYVISAMEAAGDISLNQLDALIANSSSEVHTDVEHIDGSKLVSTLADPIVNRKSDYGAFSEDSVVGAVRVSFTQYTDNAPDFRTFFGPGSGNYTLDSTESLLWIPRSDVYLQDTASTAQNDWTLKTSSSWGQNTVDFLKSDNKDITTMTRIMGDVLDPQDEGITYAEAASQHWYYDRTKTTAIPYSARFTQVTDAVTNLSTASDTTIATISNTMRSGNYYYGKCRVKLWIEGCDAEARRAIDGGSFFFGFDLSGK